MERWQLQQMQGLPLEVKIVKSQLRIREWYEHWASQVCVSFSGGKDSTVLLHLVRSIYPNVPAFFVDTGLEYPEIKQFVKTYDNVVIVRPKISFADVIKKYGYPAISKEVSNKVYYARLGSSWAIDQLNGWHTTKDGKPFGLSLKKWKHLIHAPFNISDKCCSVMKKRPAQTYYSKSKQKPFIGTLACESQLRQSGWLRTGCNAFNGKSPKSTPIAFWTEQDILRYIKLNNLPIASVYGDIIEDGEQLKLTGAQRTGCMFCMFGVHLERAPNRFQRMAKTHPQLYDYCIAKLGCGQVLDYLGVNYTPEPEQLELFK